MQKKMEASVMLRGSIPSFLANEGKFKAGSFAGRVGCRVSKRLVTPTNESYLWRL